MKNHPTLESLRKESLEAEIQPSLHSWKKLHQQLGENQSKRRPRNRYALAIAAMSLAIVAFLGWNMGQNILFSGMFQDPNAINLTNLEEESTFYSGPQLYQSAEMNRLRKAYTLLGEQAHSRE